MTRLRTLLVHGAPLLALGVASVVSIGCQSEQNTSFPPGLDPIANDNVPAPSPDLDAGDGGGEYPETLALQQGSDSTSNYVFATGYVAGSIADVWAAFQIPNVVVDRHAITSYTVTNNVETGYDVSFLTAYTIKSGIITVQYDLTWREGVVGGTQANPTQVSVVYEKTWGSSYVSLMEGSIQLVAVAPGVTELQFAQRMNATDTDSGTIASWTNELFASVVAQVHGQALP